MENYVSLFIATLEHLGHLSADEAKKLAEKLRTSTVPGSYDEVSKMIKTTLADLNIERVKILKK